MSPYEFCCDHLAPPSAKIAAPSQNCNLPFEMCNDFFLSCVAGNESMRLWRFSLRLQRRTKCSKVDFIRWRKKESRYWQAVLPKKRTPVLQSQKKCKSLLVYFATASAMLYCMAASSKVCLLRRLRLIPGRCSDKRVLEIFVESFVKLFVDSKNNCKNICAIICRLTIRWQNL